MEERRKPFKLLVHEASFSEDELLVDRKWMPNVRNGSLLEIVHPAATDRRLVLRVALLGAGDNDGEASGMGDGGSDGRARMGDKSGADGDDVAPEVAASGGADLRDAADTELVSARPAISVLKSVASLLALPTSSLSSSSGTAMDPLGVPHEVLLAPAVAGSCVVQYVEVTFVDIYISQADVWQLKHELVGGAIFLGQQLGSATSRAGASSSSALPVGPAKTLVQVNELRGPSRGNGAGYAGIDGRDASSSSSSSGIGGGGDPLRSGIVTAGTKWVFRSCSARFIGLIPITRELFEFEGEQSPSRSCLEASSHIDGDHSMLLHERVGALMQELMARWTSATGRVSLGAAGGAGGGHVRHSLTIVVFCRVCYTRDALTRAAWEDETSHLIFGRDGSDGQPGVTVQEHNQRRAGSTNAPCLVRAREGAAPLSSAFANAGEGSAMGAYSDFYRIVVDNETVPEWETLCSRVRVAIADATQHMCSRLTLGRLAPRLEVEAQRLRELAAEAEAAATTATEEAREEDARRLGIGESFADDESRGDGAKMIAQAKAAQANARAARRRAVNMELLAAHRCEGVPSDAEFCPLLEATNLALNIFEKEYMDRDLRRSNQSLLVLSAGSGVFVVDEALEQMTEQRLIDKGIGMDVVSVGSPPLHYVPLFVHASKSLGAQLTPMSDAVHTREKSRTTYSMPQWVQLYFHNRSGADDTAGGMDESAQTDEAWGGAPVPSASVPNVLPMPQSAALPSHARAAADADKRASHSMRNARVLRDRASQSARQLGIDDTAADQAAFVPLPSTQFRLRLQQPHQTVALRALLHSADAQAASPTSATAMLATNQMSTALVADAALVPPEIPAMRAAELDEAGMMRYDDDLFKRPQVLNDADGNRSPQSLNVPAGGATATSNPRSLAQHRRKAQNVNGCAPGALTHDTLSANVASASDNTEDQLSELVDTKARQLQQQQKRFRAQQAWQKQWQRRRQQQQQQQWQQQQRMQQQQRQQEQKQELTNPFCARSRSTMLNRTTANTRRWSQIFPGRQESTWRSTQRINWKGLVMPAMLPITTDYFPARSVLQSEFHETPPYNVEPPESQIGMDAMQLLRELVVQRLEQHFQLVHESQPKSPSQQHHQHQQQQQQQAQGGQRVEYQRRLLAKGEVQRPDGGILSRSQTKHEVGSGAARSLPMDAVSVSYWLSKGHRIHKLSCDAQAQHVTVRTFSQRHEERTTYNYRYALWQPLVKSFQPVTQSFAKFRAEKLNWNQLDTAISTADAAESYIHDPRAFSQQQQMKRIRGSIVPPSAPSAADLVDYETRFHKFVAYLDSLRDTQGQHSGRRVEIVARPVRPNKRRGDASAGAQRWSMRDAFMPKAQMLRLEMTTATTAALMASGAGVSTGDGATAAAGASTRCEWLYIVYDAEFDPRECWHLEVHWFACHAGTVQEFLAAMRRKAKANGLRFVDVLEFSRQSDLSQSVNPFRAPILITPHAFGSVSPEAADAAIAEVELNLVRELGFVGDGGFARTGYSGVHSDDGGSYVGGGVICRQYQHASLPIFVRRVHPAQLYWVMSRQAMSPELAPQTRALWRRLVVLTFASAAWEVQIKRRAIKTAAAMASKT